MSLPWIELHTSLPRHRKAVHLGLLLGDERAWTYMAQLWLWCAESCTTGKLTGTVASQVIECAAGWKGEPGIFADAARESGFLSDIEGGLMIHGWEERASAHIAKRERDAERAKDRREKVASRYVARTSHGRPPDVAPTSDGRSADVARTSTGTVTPTGTPTGTQKKEEEAPAPPQIEPPQIRADTPATNFFVWAQEKRRKAGCIRERPPNLSKLGTWFSEAMSEMQGDEGRLRDAFLAFGDDRHWQRASPPCPFNAFMSQWEKYAPRRVG